MTHRLLIVSLNGDPLADLGSEHAGGQCKYVLELSKNLILNGWSVHVITLAGAPRPDEETVTYGFSISRLSRLSGKPYDYDLSETEIAQLGATIAERIDGDLSGFHAVLACYWVSALACLSAPARCAPPLLVTYCSLAHFKMAAAPSAALQRRAELEAEIGRRCKAIIATNSLEAAALQDVYGIASEKVHVIPRGVDLSAFASSGAPC